MRIVLRLLNFDTMSASHDFLVMNNRSTSTERTSDWPAPALYFASREDGLKKSRHHSCYYQWPAMFCLSAEEFEDDYIEQGRNSIAEFIQTQRPRVKQLLSKRGDASGSTIHFHPEYMLVHAIYLLSKHPDFPSEADAQAEDEPYALFQVMLSSLLGPLFSSTSKGQHSEVFHCVSY